MELLISNIDLDSKKSRDQIPLECIQCGKTHYRTKNEIQRVLKGESVGKNKGCYCSKKCRTNASSKQVLVTCKECNSQFYKDGYKIIENKNNFCSSSCAASYNNKHKTKGTRKSKLECWLEIKLPALYPSLEFHFNRKDAINSELDIYIPKLKLAFELNGIFHYEPIYGADKLGQIKNNDTRKFQACIENGIELCIIDTSKLSYFKESNAIKYLEIIQNIINTKI